jgi:hypothetical protein
MKKSLIIVIAGTLTACGGGGAGDVQTGTTSGSAVTEVSAPGTVAISGPIQPSGGTVLNNSASVSITQDGGNFILQNAGTVNVTVVGNTNNVTFGQGQPADTVTIGGNGNTIVFRAGTSVRTLTVTGATNTLWIPTGSGIVVANTAPASTVIKIYTP